MSEEVSIKRSLLETMAWCASRARLADPKWSLRSAELKPPADYDGDDPIFWNEPHLIEHVAKTRAKLCGESAIEPVPGGRLLLCYFEENNHNYASAEESNGFFDGYDNPPWDTWVGQSGGALVAWVPPDFVALAQAGIEAECVGMLDWGDAAPRIRKTPQWLTRLALDLRGRT